jgi:hypothetical protein
MALADASDSALATITTDKRNVFIKRANTVISSEPHGKKTLFVHLVFLGVPVVFGSARKKRSTIRALLVEELRLFHRNQALGSALKTSPQPESEIPTVT